MVSEATTAKTTHLSSQEKYKLFIQDGIMHHEFIQEFSVPASLELQDEALIMLREKKIETIPVIVDFRDVTESTFKLTMGEYSKVITSKDFIRHTSGIWLVGMKGKMKSIANLVNKVFFGGRLRIVDTIEEAQNEAKAALSDPRPILEH